jgi:hypothetical protein
MPPGGCTAPTPVVDPPPPDGDAPDGDAPDAGRATRVVVIGDYGNAGPVEQAVSELVHGLAPDFIVTTGDNNYPDGSADTIDFNVGLFYHDFLSPYLGQYGCGGARNRFFPSLGNHDWYTPGAAPYLAYFTLPGNERYYDVAWGDVHVFALDTDPGEPDGLAPDSAQGQWLRAGLAAATEPWRIVYMHRPPFSSGPHGSSLDMQWPFKAWGANLVLAGHDHDYERVVVDGLTYVVDGLGGAELYPVGEPIEGSVVRFNDTAGALVIDADATALRARFLTVDGRQVDTFSLPAP